MTASSATPSTYDRFPRIDVPGHAALVGAGRALGRIGDTARARSAAPLVAIDCYPGVDLAALKRDLRAHLADFAIVDVEEAAALDEAALTAMMQRWLTDDRVFGVLAPFRLEEFFDPARLDAVRDAVRLRRGPTIVVGLGATLAGDADVVVLADMPRWEIQQRQRRGAANWRCTNGDEDILRKYKRGFFVEWRVADRHKQALFDRIDFLIDTTDVADVKLISGAAFRAGLRAAAARPFRLMPFFDPGVWGGQWMKSTCGLDPATPNYAWCFDCVPEENSLLLGFGAATIEIPAIDLVFRHPVELLGDRTHARFGKEFPIRFDLLDTVGGGNLSLQVHPLIEYIQDRFGMHYTQDESYYILDAAPDSSVYLGVREGVASAEMIAALRLAATGAAPFPAERFVNRFPARKHDHFLIPAGTVHCSGAGTMVLEISATPYIFTFKLWDWGRLGLDGRPRPVHIEHGEAVIQWQRDTAFARDQLVNRIETVATSDGCVEERTGLHQREFIEVRRHWFTRAVRHHTRGTVNVLNLVAGREAEISSPTGAFAPYVVHYAETFVVPAAVGDYTISPTAASAGDKLATVKAYVRGTEVGDGAAADHARSA